MLDTLLHDLRYATRQLARSPGFTAVTVLTLALGIGANTTVFSLVNAVLLRPLPVHEPSRLVRIYTSEWSVTGVSSRRYGSSSFPDYRAVAERRDIFVGATAHMSIGPSLAKQRGGAGEPVHATLVSGDYFEVLGVRAALGRTFMPAEDEGAGAHPVVVLSYSGWRDHFGGDSAVVGQTVYLNGYPFTIVGVAARRFRGVEIERAPLLWVPLAMHLEAQPGSDWIQRGDSRGLAIMARLQPGVSLAQARDGLRRIAAARAEESPATNENRTMTLVPGSTLFQPNGPPVLAFGLIMLVVGVVLLIACANAANLLLARAARRRREIAIRLALGAGRRRLVGQLLTESLLLALLGAGAGLLLALWGVDAARSLPLPRTLDITPDGRVLAFTLALAVLTALLFGLAPALQATGASVVPALKDAAAAGGAARSRLRGALVSAQVALTLMLLVPAGLLVRSLQQLAVADPGFAVERILVAQPMVETRASAPAERQRFFDELLERVRAHPGVHAASLASTVPLSGSRMRTATDIQGYQRGPTEENEIDFLVVGDDYFRTMDIPLRRGRAFTTDDRPGAPRVAIVSESMARRYWGARNPIGQHLYRGGDRERPIEVVGVAADASYESLTSHYPYYYLPAAQSPSFSGTLHVRTEGDPATVIAALRAIVRSIDPEIPLRNVQTLREVRAESLTGSRLATQFLGLFGTLALVLASLGLYGVMAYAVAQRTHEIGIRMALGAARADVARLVLGQGMRMVAVGAVLGGIAALGVAAALRGMLYGVRPVDPVSLLGVGGLLALVAIGATWVPVRRATRVDPVVALRTE
jgi:predicted permease